MTSSKIRYHRSCKPRLPHSVIYIECFSICSIKHSHHLSTFYYLLSAIQPCTIGPFESERPNYYLSGLDQHVTGLVLKGSPRHDHSNPTFISGQNPQELLQEMALRLRSWRNTIQRKLPSFRRASNVSPPTLVPLKTPVEEETLPYYKLEHYYPVNIGDVYETRYQIVGKLGYGTYSTSWLCHDLQYVSRSLIITSES